MLTLLTNVVLGILTVAAWRKGWHGRALLPLVFLLSAGFLLGTLLAHAGHEPADFQLAGRLLDGAAIACLTLMWLEPARAAAGAGEANRAVSQQSR